MKEQSDVLIQERQKLNVQTYWLVEVGTSFIFYFTNCPYPIFYNGHTYNPVPLKISGFETSDGSPLDEGTIEIGNVDITMSSMVLNGVFRNADLILSEIWFIPGTKVYLAITTETGDAIFTDGGTVIDIGASTPDSYELDVIFRGQVDGRPELDLKWCKITGKYMNTWLKQCPPRFISKKDFPTLPRPGTKFTWGNTIITIT